MTDTAPLSDSIDNVVLVGCGKMGSAMLRSWVERGVAGHVHVIDPVGLPDDLADNNTLTHYSAYPEKFHRAPDVVLIAVKPQILTTTLEQVNASEHEGTLFLSIAAGKPIHAFEKLLGQNVAVVRSMPNTPAAIGQGIIAAVKNRSVTEEQRKKAHVLLACSGDVVWLEQESLMDAVTAVSGSGPAYVFHLIEVMAQAGEKLGLPSSTAMKLARQTVIGSAALAKSEAEVPAQQLRQNVTSPGGTTEAALEVLMGDSAMQELFDKALKAAQNRGIELSKK